MSNSKLSRNISNTVYGIGAAVVIALVLIAAIGGNAAPNPDAMIPFTYKEISSIWLAVGAVPTVAACIAAYRFNDVRHSPHKRRTAALIFLPAVLPAVCALFWGGALLLGYINMFLNWGR